MGETSLRKGKLLGDPKDEEELAGLGGLVFQGKEKMDRGPEQETGLSARVRGPGARGGAERGGGQSRKPRGGPL